MNSSYYWYMLLFSQWSLIISNPPPPTHTHMLYVSIPESQFRNIHINILWDPWWSIVCLLFFFITKTITHVYNTNDAQTIRANFRVLRSAVSRHLSRANSCKYTIKYTEYPQIRSTSFWSFFITIQTCSFGQMNTKIVFSHWHFFC